MITENEKGQQNLWATEPRMYTDPTIEQQMKDGIYETHNEKAEKLNGRLAMLGIVAAMGAYALTGQIVPGLW